MDNRAFFITLTICGFLSILFQAIGIFAPAWLILHVDLNDGLSEKIELGIFSGHACITTAIYGENCVSFSTEKMSELTGKYSAQSNSDGIGADDLPVFNLTLILLVLFGGAASVCALCIMFEYCRSATKDRSRRKLCTLGVGLWFGSAILYIAAIGYYLRQYFKISSILDAISESDTYSSMFINTNFPWATYMLGFGSLFAILTGALLLFRLCHIIKARNTGVATWQQFTNEAVIIEEPSNFTGNTESTGSHNNA